MSGVSSTISDNGRVYLFDRNCLPKNFIEQGMKFIPSGLSLGITPGTCDIDGKFHELTEQVSTVLYASRAQLVYAIKNDVVDTPALGVKLAAFPAADTGTVCRYIVNGDAVIANTAADPSKGGNLTRVGAVTAVPGWAADTAGQGDGATGYYSSANSTGFPIGAAVRAYSFVYTCASVSGYQYFGLYGASAAISVGHNGARLTVTNEGTAAYDTGFDLEVGKTYYFEVCYNGTNIVVYVNGVLIYTSAAFVAATTAGVFRVMSGGGSGYCSGILHYVELRNALRTPAQIAAISNALLLPCRYYADPAKPDFTDIRSILPTNTISLGLTRTNTSGVTEYDDSSYKYGRREGAVNGNRKVFLGWKYATGGAYLTWDNPFGTRKVKTYWVTASDALGTNEGEAAAYYSDSANQTWGVRPDLTSAYRLRAFAGSNGLYKLNGTWYTSGYIGCYAEVIE